MFQELVYITTVGKQSKIELNSEIGLTSIEEDFYTELACQNYRSSNTSAEWFANKEFGLDRVFKQR